MQRAAAANHTPSSLSTRNIYQERTDPPSAKRQKLSGSESSTPDAATLDSDLAAIAVVVSPEERKRTEARSYTSRVNRGETEWVLNLPQQGTHKVNGSSEHQVDDRPNIVEEDEPWADRTIGRRSYGDFKRRKAQSTTSTLQNAEEEDDGELSEEGALALSTPDVNGYAWDPTWRHQAPRESAKNKNRIDLKRNSRLQKKEEDYINLKEMHRKGGISGFSPKPAPRPNAHKSA